LVRVRVVDPVEEDSVLPPGQRDRSGFWYPKGYLDPRSLIRRKRRGSHAKGLPKDRRMIVKQL